MVVQRKFALGNKLSRRAGGLCKAGALLCGGVFYTRFDGRCGWNPETNRFSPRRLGQPLHGVGS